MILLCTQKNLCITQQRAQTSKWIEMYVALRETCHRRTKGQNIGLRCFELNKDYV
jgi:hypothetical protein